jgi:phosphoadenosine phosphosulfate reductase
MNDEPSEETATHKINLGSINARLATMSPQQIIDWAFGKFGETLVASTSFGSNSAILLHMIARSDYPIRIIHIDTGDLPEENRMYAKELVSKLKISLTTYRSEDPFSEHDSYLRSQGDAELQQFYERRKLKPMRRALFELSAQAILHGIRADQNKFRNTLQHVEKQNDGRLRIYPLLNMSEFDATRYVLENALPVHSDGLPKQKENIECGLHIEPLTMIKGVDDI